MSANEAWMLAGMVAVTFGIRYLLFGLAERIRLAPWLSDSLKFIPPAVLTPSVVTGQSAVSHRGTRRRAPILAGIGALGLAVAFGALIVVRPWEAAPPLDAIDHVPAVTRSVTSRSTPPPATTSPRHDEGLGLTDPTPPPPPTPLPAPTVAIPTVADAGLATTVGDPWAADAASRTTPSVARADRRRPARSVEPRAPRPPRVRRGDGLVDGVPIADEGGFRP